MEMTELVVGGRMQASPCPVATWWDHSLLVPGLLLRLPRAPVVLLGNTSGPWYSPWAKVLPAPMPGGFTFLLR